MRNNYEVRGDDVWIELRRKGEIMWTVIEASDLALVLPLSVTWYPNPARAPRGKFYVNGKLWVRETQSTKTIMLHQVIGGPTDYEIHHKDNDGLNNRRSNIEVLTHIQNMRERDPGKDWHALDDSRVLAAEYRKERDISRAIAMEYDITRHAMWMIRTGRTLRSKAAIAYVSATCNAKVRTLEQLQIDNPKKMESGESPRTPIHGDFSACA